jgi:hypothetical protein
MAFQFLLCVQGAQRVSQPVAAVPAAGLVQDYTGATGAAYHLQPPAGATIPGKANTAAAGTATEAASAAALDVGHVKQCDGGEAAVQLQSRQQALESGR